MLVPSSSRRASRSAARAAPSERLARLPLRSARLSAPTNYRKTVLEVATRLRPEDEEELRFAMKDVVPPESQTSEGKRAVSGIALMECLEQHELLGPSNRSFLLKCLRDMGRQDLADLVAPPEDVGASPRPPHTSSAHARLLSMFRGNISSFRKVTLDVSRELGEEEVEKLCWLSKDFFSNNFHLKRRIKNSVELLNAMEESNLLGPGNYSFLVDCLQEIGRDDLVSVIEPPSLPYLHPSFSLQAQLFRRRIESVSMKKTQYKFGMRSLVTVRQVASQTTAKNAGAWFHRICGSLSPKNVYAHSDYIIENLPITLINMSLHMNYLLSAVDEYSCNGDTKLFASYLSDCETHLNILQGLMEAIGWDSLPRKRETIATSRQYHPVRQASYGAFSGLVEFTLELSTQRGRVQEETRQLSSVLNRLESVLRLAGFMWSLTSWLIALLQVSVRSPICLDKYKGLLRIIMNRNRELIYNNSEMIETVLSGTYTGRVLLGKLKAKRIIFNQHSKDTRSSSTDNSTIILLQTAIVPMLVFTFVIILLSEFPSLSPEELEDILSSLKLYIEGQVEGFCQANSQVTMMVLDGIYDSVESYRQSRMHDIHPQFYNNEIFSF